MEFHQVQPASNLCLFFFLYAIQPSAASNFFLNPENDVCPSPSINFTSFEGSKTIRFGSPSNTLTKLVFKFIWWRFVLWDRTFSSIIFADTMSKDVQRISFLQIHQRKLLHLVESQSMIKLVKLIPLVFRFCSLYSWTSLELNSSIQKLDTNNGELSHFCNCCSSYFGYLRFDPKILKMCKTVLLI